MLYLYLPNIMANPFAKFFKLSATPLGKKSVESAVGIDIGSSSIKVVQVSREKEKLVLATYGELAVGPYADLSIGASASFGADKLISIVSDLFKEAGVTAVTVAFSIPLKSSLILVVEMPDLPLEALAQAVPIEARKYIPVPIAEVGLDWQPLPRERQNFANVPVGEKEKLPKTTDPTLKGVHVPAQKIEVLLAAIHKETIALYQKLAQGLKIEPRFFEIETFSTLRSVVSPSDRAPVAVIDMGASSTKMTIVEGGMGKISHTIGKGSQDVTGAISKSLSVDFAKAEEIKRELGLSRRGVEADTLSVAVTPIVEYIFTEANRVIVNYQRRYKRPVDRALLVGGGALLRGTPDIAVRRLGLDVAIAHPFERLNSPPSMSRVLEEAGPSFAVAIGLAERLLLDA